MYRIIFNKMWSCSLSIIFQIKFKINVFSYTLNFKIKLNKTKFTKLIETIIFLKLSHK